MRSVSFLNLIYRTLQSVETWDFDLDFFICSPVSLFSFSMRELLMASGLVWLPLVPCIQVKATPPPKQGTALAILLLHHGNIHQPSTDRYKFIHLFFPALFKEFQILNNKALLQYLTYLWK